MAAKFPLVALEELPSLTPELLRLAYMECCLTRSHVQRVVQECAKGNIRFSIWGCGEEVHGVASALAFHDVVNPDAFGIFAHYRSASLLALWARLRGYEDFHLDHMRQQFSRISDPWSGGRQMTAHFNAPSQNIMPVQSSLGMQLGKAVGYALGMRRKGFDDGVVVGILGDGTMGESDFHESATGASVLELPVLMNVTDNDVAISVTPKDGRGIKDLRAYAKAFGFAFFETDGNDFSACYQASHAAATYCRDNQRPALVWTRNLSRLNGHSSAADITFDLEQFDVLADFGQALVDAGVLDIEDITRRNEETEGRDYYKRHHLGRIGQEADDYIVGTHVQTLSEPQPSPESIYDHIRDPFQNSEEPPALGRPTNVSLNGAIRAALRDILAENPLSWIYGQDVAQQGGVMGATRGLQDAFPEQVRDSPINEPLILGAATGFALHPGATAIPEIQFSDYSLNTLHWLVYLGNVLWTSNGTVRTNVVLRLPVEPLHGGAVYHSMCMEGFYGAIPGLTIVAPTTSRDCYGLLRSAADYSGPVIVFESKGLYRQALGDAFDTEPTDRREIAQMKRAIGMDGMPAKIDPNFRVPLGKAAVRRTGHDLTIVTWGRATIFCAQAAETLAAQGVDVEVIDMRTIVPPDMDCVCASVEKTGRLLVVHEDRVFSGLGRELQGAVIERFGSRAIPSRVLGQDAVPGIPQAVALEEHIVVSPAKVVAAAIEVMQIAFAQVERVQDIPARTNVSEPSRTQVLWTPNRNFVA